MESLRRAGLVLVGLFLTALGVKVLNMGNLTTGGTAGLAIVSSYATKLSWGLCFFVINLPFFVLSWRKLGRRWTLSTLAAVATLTLLREWMEPWAFGELHPLWAALASGLILGSGITLVLNNGASLGGLQILALVLEQKWKINRGLTLMVTDGVIILLAVVLVGWEKALYSILSMAVMNLMIGRMKNKAKRAEAKKVIEEVSLSSGADPTAVNG
jgi:uncharacterized membrane-anchored protein YitT (DUF2179 family)